MADADISQKDPYFVAVKLFLERNGRLFIFKDRFSDWDLPGGRIKKHEFSTPFRDILTRKMHEEVGLDVTYTLDERPLVLMRHERVEASPGNPTVHILGIGYRALWTHGEPKLSEAHTDMVWADVQTFKPEDYFTGGWLEGVRDYLRVR